jgi:hypothetical protein
VGDACSTYGKREKFIQILVENLKEGDQLRDIGIDGKLIS